MASTGRTKAINLESKRVKNLQKITAGSVISIPVVISEFWESW